MAEQGNKSLKIVPGTIITPAARDMAQELGIEIIEYQQGTEVPASPVPGVKETNGTVTQELIAKIVLEVLAALPGGKQGLCLVKEMDPCGLLLIKGNSVRCEQISASQSEGTVGVKEVLTRRESPHLAAGIMTIERTSYHCLVEEDEVKYVLEGNLKVSVNEKTYICEAGDVFYIPKETRVTLTTTESVKLFYVSYPKK